MSGPAPPPGILENSKIPESCCGGDEHCPDALTTSGTAEISPQREPCPPPLQWQQVVAAFREQSPPWLLETASGTIRGRVWGDGPSLLFFNGLCGTNEVFALTAFLLQTQFRCVLFDYPTGWRLNWPRLCESAVTIADHFSTGKGCHVFGTSIGAALALETMVQVPSQVRSATLLSAFAHLPLTVFERSGAALCRCLPGKISSIPGWRTLQERSHRLWFPPIDATRWLFYLDNAGPTRIADVARRFGSLAQVDLRSRLRDVQTPVLLVHPEGEGAVQARCRDELAAALPNSRTEFLHTTGLLAYLTHPHRIAKLIREFSANCTAGEKR